MFSVQCICTAVQFSVYIFHSPVFMSRPGRSQGLLYKHLCRWFSRWVIQPFPPTALQLYHAQTVWDSSSSYKIDYIIVIKTFLNPDGHQNCITGSKVTAILLKWWILPIGGASAMEGLRSTGLPRVVVKAVRCLRWQQPKEAGQQNWSIRSDE